MKKHFTHDWHLLFLNLGFIGTMAAYPVQEAIANGHMLSSFETTGAGDLSTPVPMVWQISGRVTSASGDALPGVTVLLKGTTTGATTNPNGEYNLAVPEAPGVLVFSFIGFATQEKSFTGPGAVNITLSEDTKALQEVVVTGYGTQSKKDITGAVATIEAEQLLSTPATNLGQAMQGKVAGVTVGNENSPGGGVMVRNRGFGTINDNSP
jgi:TonB-dependent starch-binding outer membrane protein SusC